MRCTQRLTIGARCLVLAGVMLLGSAVIPLAGEAHFMGLPGGHWSWNPRWFILWLPVSRACSGGYYGAAGDAIANWNAASTAVQLYEVDAYGGVCDGWEHTGRIDMYTFNNVNDTNWGYGLTFTLRTFCLGIASTGCTQYLDYSVSETYNAGVIQLNTAKPRYSWPNFARPTNYFVMVGDVTHELGHTFGLAHAGAYAGESIGNYSIMDYLSSTYNTPQAHDVYDVNALYPR